MPRGARGFVECGGCQVSKRIASGESAFAESEEALELTARSAAVLEVDSTERASRSRQNHVVEARRLIITLGRERWAFRTKDLGSSLGKSDDTVTYMQREGSRQRLE